MPPSKSTIQPFRFYMTRHRIQYLYDLILFRVATIRVPRIYDAADYEDGYKPRGSSQGTPNMCSCVLEAEQ